MSNYSAKSSFLRLNFAKCLSQYMYKEVKSISVIFYSSLQCIVYKITRTSFFQENFRVGNKINYYNSSFSHSLFRFMFTIDFVFVVFDCKINIDMETNEMWRSANVVLDELLLWLNQKIKDSFRIHDSNTLELLQLFV